MLALIGDDAVGIGHLQEVDIRGTQSQRRRIVERTVDAHIVSRGDDVLDAHLLSQTHRHRVDTLGKGTLQRDGVARESTVGIAGCPLHDLVLLMVVHLHADIFVAPLVAGGQPLVHCLGIDEELERRARLSHGRHLVVFPRVEVDVAHPCTYISRLGLHSYKRAMHEAHHVADRVERRHLALDDAFLIVEELHRVRAVQLGYDRVGRVGIFG